MDSLVANYASSDDDEATPRNPKSTSKPPSPPPPKSLFASLPPPKTAPSSALSSSSSSSSIFPSANAKRVVHFRPPINPALLKSLDDDDEDEQKKKEKEKKKFASDFSSKSLSSVIPPPKNTLCLAPGASSFSSRRSNVVAPKPEVDRVVVEERQELGDSEVGYGSWGVNGSQVEGHYGLDGGGGGGDVVSTSWDAGDGAYYENYGGYGGEWEYGSTASIASDTLAPPQIPDIQVLGGKRGRSDIPLNIVEVRQDELVKNRPREDQVKMTGIAFGPAYQSVSSQKGKPTKLHKRKHQITSLYFDMKQKEMELSERRAKGMLTKRETQGKYGW